MQRPELIYLAAPYTHILSAIRAARFEAVTRAAAALIRKGRVVYSPITMTHPIDVILAGKSDTLGSDYWVTFDERFMTFCSEIIVLRLVGWQQSTGVKREIEFFRERNLPISFLDPGTDDVPDVPLPSE
jgi:uncharacterized glyoxalase superfamily metalloenzyme YdcJ